MKAKVIALFLAAILTGAGTTYAVTRWAATKTPQVLHSHADEADGATEALSIEGLETSIAVAGEGWETVVVTGNVTVPPDRLVKISPRIEGKIVAAYGTVGDTVKRGQRLAVISSVQLAEARAQYRQALARLNAANSNYARELHLVKLGAVSARPVEEARSETLSSEGELADAKGELSQALSELSQTESELAQCKARLQRARELYAGKIVSKHDLETAETEFRRDSAAVESAKSKVSLAEARIEKAKSKLDISRQYLTREERVHKERALDMRAVQSAKAELASAKIDVQSAADRIRVLGATPDGHGETISVASPIAGRIVSRNTNVGEMAAPSEPLFTVADLSQVWIEADVYEKDLARVRRGQNAEFVVDAYPGRVFSGRVDSVSDILSSESRTAKVRCVVSNPQGLLKGGMFAKVSLLTGTRGTCVLIPKQAVLDESGKKIVFTTCTDCPVDRQEGPSACGEYDKVEVRTGSVRGEQIEVLSGIAPGTEVVTVGAYQIKTAIGSGKLEAGCTDH